MKHLSLEDYTKAGVVECSPVTALSNVSGTFTLDCSLGNYFTFTMGSAATLAISNPPPSGLGQTIAVLITRGVVAGALTWPSSFKWPNATAGVLSTTTGRKDVLAITTFDGGTTWQATLANYFA